jgi:hypothetical protein
MTTIEVKTLNNWYTLEQDDAGDHRIIDTTNQYFRDAFVGLKCTAPVVGQMLYIDNGTGGHTSKVIQIER